MKKVLSLVGICIFLSYCAFGQSRPNAGLQGSDGAVSGFFDTEFPINYPAGASNWWHLLDIRHNNPINNYAMQFSGSFFDQDLFFRKTVNNPSNDWSKVVLERDGKVGLGTSTPRVKIEVNGKAIIQNTLLTNDYTNVGQHNAQLRILNGLGQYGTKALEIALLDNGTGVIQANESNVGYNTLLLNPVSGNVGIGTTDPKGYKLAVAGSMIAESVKVKLNGAWPDFVFAKSYKLPTLQETEKHIREKGHLPGIPSAAEVKASGVNLGEMNAKLLQKIEELTLHLIEKDKQIIDLNMAMKSLKKQNVANETRLKSIESIIDKLKP